MPDSIYNRKDKLGFPVPLNLWLKNERFKKTISTVITDNLSGWLNPASIDRLIDNEWMFGRDLWALINIGIWRQSFNVGI